VLEHSRGWILACSIGVCAILGSLAAAQTAPMCVGDADGDGEVTVDEIVVSVNNALQGCGLLPVTLQFQAMVGDEAFACGNSYDGIGTAGDRIFPADLRMYLSNVRLLTTMGTEVPLHLEQDRIWQFQDVVLLDFEDKKPPCGQGTVPVNTTVRGTVPPGDYSGIRFNVGVPFGLNHQNAATASSPLNLTAMFWNWQGGYKFLRFDEALDLVRVHLGSTGCEYGQPGRITSCARPNRSEVYLTNFDPSADTIVFDLATLLADSDIQANDPDTPPGCMSDPDDDDCDILLRNLGVNFSNGLPDPSRQTAFRIEKHAE